MCLALSTCENPQLITLLRAPSELKSLDIVAYAGDTQLEGGAAMEPGFTTSVFNYTVFVAKDANRLMVSATIEGSGTIEIMCEEDQETGTEFDYLDNEPKVFILTVEREYMEEAEYRVTVLREETVPTATGVVASVTPGIGAFFLGRGVLPEFEVTAHLPAAGGVLSYQWYMNYENSNRGGMRVNGATGKTYKMRRGETLIARTVYYYAEVTNTIDGKTGVIETNPCRVTFVDKDDLSDKSRAQDYMINIPATTGNVTASQWDTPNNFLKPNWSTPGFSMGQYLVTYELWKYVFDNAEAGNYRFSNSGTQGSHEAYPFIPFGNALHPVGWINWRDTVVWCNAFSEMNGLEPVYKDSSGNVLRSSREPVESLIDETKMTGNGYRLPTAEEYFYAARGASPSNSPPWTYALPGTNDPDEVWYGWETIYDVDYQGERGFSITTEVGTLPPNSLELYDMAMGQRPICTYKLACGLTDYYTDRIADVKITDYSSTQSKTSMGLAIAILTMRLARNKE
jgi:formylglycine-generating enzyme required for sulfatase activity